MAYGMNFDTINAMDAYPSAGGFSTSQQATAGVPSAPDSAGASPSQAKPQLTAIQRAAAIGSLGQPLAWWLVMIGLLVTVMFFAKHFHTEEAEFKSIKLSIYNIVVIGLAATIFLVFEKVVFTRWPVKGVSAVMLAA